MRKLFSEYGLLLLVILISIYCLNMISYLFINKDGQMLIILKDWIGNLV